MNASQSNITEDLGYSPISPDVIDISSESGEEFIVEPGNIAQIDERFRINTMGSNIMAAFVGSATTVLFPHSNPIDRQGTIDTTGTNIGREIMELIGESPLSPSTYKSKQLWTACCWHIAHAEDSETTIEWDSQTGTNIPSELLTRIFHFSASQFNQCQYSKNCKPPNARSRKCTFTNRVHSNRATIPSRRWHYTNGYTFASQIYGGRLR